MAISNGRLFFSPNDRVLRYDFAGNELVPSAPAVTLVSGLPANGDHPRKTVVSNGRGNLFVNFGSASNTCQVENRVAFSPGIDPCPELAIRAGVWKFSDSRSGQTQRDGQRFATETRNLNALTINPLDGQLYGACCSTPAPSFRRNTKAASSSHFTARGSTRASSRRGPDIK